MLALHPIDKRPSRLAALPLAIAFLIETWIWRKLVALATYLASLVPWARFRDHARRVLNRAPAFVSVALFGVPLFVAEFGAFISVVMMATGHVFAGMALYVGMKIFGLLLIPLIFELTRERLMALPWFAWAYAKFEGIHHAIAAFVAPYRQAAWELLYEARDWAYRVWSARRASVAKAETSASSARAVGERPASPNH